MWILLLIIILVFKTWNKFNNNVTVVMLHSYCILNFFKIHLSSHSFGIFSDHHIIGDDINERIKKKESIF